MEESAVVTVTNQSSNTPALEVITADAIVSAHKEVVECTWRLMETGNEFIRKAAACGRLLAAKKSALGHGNFLPWLSENIKEFGCRIAQDYMKTARYVEENTHDGAYLGSAQSFQAIRDLRKAVGILEDKPEPDPQEREKPAFVIRCVFNTDPEKFDEHQRKDAIEQSKPWMQVLESWGVIEIKAA